MSKEPDGGGRQTHWLASIVETLFKLRNDQIAPFLVIGVVVFGAWFVGWKWPEAIDRSRDEYHTLLRDEMARNREANAVEWERNRVHAADRDRQILQAFQAEGKNTRESMEDRTRLLMGAITKLEIEADRLRRKLDKSE